MRVLRLPAYNPGPYTGSGTNTYLLAGRMPTLIDAGTGEARHLQDVADALASDAARLAQVLATHGHRDHVGGAAAIADRWPSARFAKLPWPEHDSRDGVAWQPIADDEQVAAGDGSVWALHTPGHSPDHLAFFDVRSGLLFAGDLVVNGGTVMIPASHGGSLALYLKSLRRVLELDPRQIMPGHGDPIDRPAALLRGYIAHRLARERQLVEALRPVPRTVDALVGLVYRDLQEDLRGAAAESILAHLVKLQEEQRAIAEPAGDGTQVWRLTTSE